MLRNFYESIDEVITSDIELAKMLPVLRDSLKNALMVDDFRLNCVEKILDSIDAWSDDVKSWNAPAIFENKKLNYSVKVIFWPAFYENNPHQHKTWGVTGVFDNDLNINTYTLMQEPMRLKKERTITAKAGEVGYLLPGCIHNVCNPSHELSASIHIFNNLPGIENSEENAIWYPAPRKYNLSKGLIERALSSCLSILRNIHTKKSCELIDRIYSISSISIRISSINALYGIDRVHAALRFKELQSNF